MLKRISLIGAAAISLALTTQAPKAQAQVGVDIAPEQYAYQARTDARIREWIHQENHEASEEERTFIGEHWRRAAKIWRIRKLANDAHDAATVARCDALLLRADSILEHQLARMRMHAAVMQYAPGGVEVATAPPPPQVEVQGAAPSPRDVWTPGYWQWNGSRHVWVHGHWAEPPQLGMTWEPPRWENRGGHYYFNDGRWRAAAVAPTVVYEPPPVTGPVLEVQAQPPAPIVEIRPAAPSPNHVWIPGYWNWNGSRHVWIGGRWSAPRAGMRWEPDHWVHTGAGWRMEHGRWGR
jgi:hypothetical protein